MARTMVRSKICRLFLALIYLICINYLTLADESKIKISVNNDIREVLIYNPDNSVDNLYPVIIAFHGHGSSMDEASIKFQCQKYWPEAIVVYPQGLKTAGTIIDKKGKYSGWQASIGDQDNRDLKFFDLLLDYLENNYNIDTNRIFIMGHSNGGLFTYELWSARRNKIAAICSISSIIPLKIDKKSLEPIPIYIVAGRNDQLVKFRFQQKDINYLVELNECELSTVDESSYITRYKSNIGFDIETYISNGGHDIPPNVMPYIIDFFKSINVK